MLLTDFVKLENLLFFNFMFMYSIIFHHNYGLTNYEIEY